MDEERLQEIEAEAGHVASPVGAEMIRALVAEVRRMREAHAMDRLAEAAPGLLDLQREAARRAGGWEMRERCAEALRQAADSWELAGGSGFRVGLDGIRDLAGEISALPDKP